MELDEELDLQSSEEGIDVGEDHSDINDDGIKGEDGTPELVIPEQAPTASTGVCRS